MHACVCVCVCVCVHRENNCNHFSDALSKLLVDKGIPEAILTQHEVLLHSPMGQQLMPMLMQVRTHVSGCIRAFVCVFVSVVIYRTDFPPAVLCALQGLMTVCVCMCVCVSVCARADGGYTRQCCSRGSGAPRHTALSWQLRQAIREDVFCQQCVTKQM